jgi:hypothetical protein
MCTHYYRVTYYFKFALAAACIKLSFYWENLHLTEGFIKSVVFVALVYKAVDQGFSNFSAGLPLYVI